MTTKEEVAHGDAGNFAQGDYREFKDTSWNGNYPDAGFDGPNVVTSDQIVPGPNGGYAYRVVVDDRAVNLDEDGNGTLHQRVHVGISLAKGNPNPGHDGDVWAGSRTIMFPSGFECHDVPVVADEYHVQGFGVAPMLLKWWLDSETGRPQVHSTLTGGYGGNSYGKQVTFGPPYPGQDLEPGVEYLVPFEGGFVPQLDYDTRYHYRWAVGWGSEGEGTYTLEWWDDDADDWVVLVPPTSGLYIGYGSGKDDPAYFLSVYGDCMRQDYAKPGPEPEEGHGARSVEYSAGFLRGSYDELKARQDERLGPLVQAGSDPVPPDPVPPDPVPPDPVPPDPVPPEPKPPRFRFALRITFGIRFTVESSGRTRRFWRRLRLP